MRTEMQTEAVHVPASTGRIGFDRTRRSLGEPTATTRCTSRCTAAPGAYALGSID
jgi:hypothetical protein